MNKRRKSVDIDVIFKIAAVGILVTIVCQILKKSDREDIATIVSLAGLVIVKYAVIGQFVVPNIFPYFQVLFLLLE